MNSMCSMDITASRRRSCNGRMQNKKIQAQRLSRLEQLPDELMAEVFMRLAQRDAHTLYSCAQAFRRSPAINACITHLALNDLDLLCRESSCGTSHSHSHSQSRDGSSSTAEATDEQQHHSALLALEAMYATAQWPKHARAHHLTITSARMQRFVSSVLADTHHQQCSTVRELHLQLCTSTFDAELVGMLAQLCPAVTVLHVEGAMCVGAISAAAVAWPGMHRLTLQVKAVKALQRHDEEEQLQSQSQQQPGSTRSASPAWWPEVAQLLQLREVHVDIAGSQHVLDLSCLGHVSKLQHLHLRVAGDERVTLLRGVQELQCTCPQLASLTLGSDFCCDLDEGVGALTTQSQSQPPAANTWPALESVRLSGVTYGLFAQLQLSKAPCLQELQCGNCLHLYQGEEGFACTVPASVAHLAAMPHLVPQRVRMCVCEDQAVANLASHMRLLDGQVEEVEVATDQLQPGDGALISAAVPNLRELCLDVCGEYVEWGVAAELLQQGRMTRLQVLRLQGDHEMQLEDATEVCEALVLRGGTTTPAPRVVLPMSDLTDEMLLCHMFPTLQFSMQSVEDGAELVVEHA